MGVQTFARRKAKDYQTYLLSRSHAVPGFFNRNAVWLAAAWIALVGFASLIRLAFPAAPIEAFSDALPIIVAYIAVILSPIAGFLIARSAFSGKTAHRPLDFHLSFYGKWRPVGRKKARSMPSFGPYGFVASLLIGMVLNIVVRTGEYFVAIPALSSQAPDWGLVLFAVMTGDLIIMNFLYIVAFVMALRSIPLFPRMLLFVWLVDVMMQLVIARQMSAVGSLPEEVALPLAELLQGNVVKVLISVAVWLPYLILSRRINLTYRSRIRD